MLRGQHLIHDRRSDNLEPDRLFQIAQKPLVQRADITFAQADVLLADNALAFERAYHGDNIAKQTYLGGHEHRPR
ncbi:hypothetical protein D9M71_730600 [compost metagenome]